MEETSLSGPNVPQPKFPGERLPSGALCGPFFSFFRFLPHPSFSSPCQASCRPGRSSTRTVFPSVVGVLPFLRSAIHHLVKLLLLCGDVHPHPGPFIFSCSVCDLEVSRKGYSFLCPSCHCWLHKPCSQLRSITSYLRIWFCPSCSLTQSTTVSPSVCRLPRRLRTTPPFHLLLPSVASHISPSPCILQFNCNGIRHCAAELSDFLHANNITVTSIQETNPNVNSSFAIPNFTIVRRDRPGVGRGGGIAFLVHHSVSFH